MKLGEVVHSLAMRFTIEIEKDGDAASGWVEAAGGRRRRFVGLLELIALLDGAREVPSLPGEDDGHGHPGA